MKLALIQMKGGNAEVQKNLDEACKKIQEAALNGADFAVLPEMFSCPYSAKNFPLFAEEEGGKAFLEMSRIARENHIYLAAGSMPEKEVLEKGGKTVEKIYNTSYVFDREGKKIAKHRKIHLFECDIPGARFHESETLSAGNEITLFDTEFGRFGLMICFDIRFPELSRIYAEKGAVFTIVPAAFNMTSGPLWWDLMFRSRSCDNQFFMCGVSPARNEKAPYVAYGHSVVTDPKGVILGELDEKEGILYSEIDFNLVKKTRTESKLLDLRRKDVYSSCGL